MRYFGKKIGMLRVFPDDENFVAATLVELYPLRVLGHRTVEKDGYNALIVGFDEISPEEAERKLNKPQLGFQKKIGLDKFYRKVREIKVENPGDYNVGDYLKVEIKPKDKVMISGITKGRGFAGVVKRYNFAGSPKTHGAEQVLRRPMSAGATGPQRVFKGKKMPGHMGNRRVTFKNIEVIDVDLDRNFVLLKGSVPGPNRGLVEIKV